MSCRKFQAVSSALHLSDPKVGTENAKNKGTPAFDRLCEVKPVYDQIRDVKVIITHIRTLDLFIYEGKSLVAQSQQNKGLSYVSVMALVDEKVLGSGYKLYVDNFYTSLMLFRDLLQRNISACGTIRSNRAHGRSGYVRCPHWVLLRKNRKGYHSFFFDFVDIAVVNAFIIQQQLAAMQSKRAKNLKELREALVQELADWVPPPDAPVASAAPDAPAPHHPAGHTPKHIKPSSKARRRCRMCHQKSPVICGVCDLPLCFIPKRDCFSRWHDGDNL
ncbi:unnamed protein product [Leuciscus chuanchicus]